MTNTATDPRPAYATATEWVRTLITNVTEDRLGDPTPCDEFDVRTLIRHLLATVLRAEALATAATVDGVPVLADRYDAESFAAARTRALAAWADAPLEREVTVPWGVVPGFAALGMYVSEALVHGWDLAVATGQPAEVPDPAIAEATLAAVRAALPPEIRGLDTVPFAPVVEPRPGAGPTERLANFTGHSAARLVGA